MQQFPTDAYPHLVEMVTEYILRPGYDFGDEFDFGLDVILGALTPLLARDNTDNADVDGESVGAQVVSIAELSRSGDLAKDER